MDQKDIAVLAKKIREARRQARLSQTDLAKGIGLSDKAISSYESGRSVPPIERLSRIAQQTQQPMSYFTGGELSDVELLQKLTQVEQELQALKKILLSRKAK